MNEDFLHKKLEERRAQHALRYLRPPEGKTDFCSNDYLGIVRDGLIGGAGAGYRHGSGGSRLLAGNYPLIEDTERLLAAFHEAPAGLIFNSGYDANLGLLSCISQRGDAILYDQLSHASIRDGIRLSFGRSFSFLHNDCGDLGKKLQAAQAAIISGGNIFVVTESVFSMDGDQAPLREMAVLCTQYGAHLIVDEAHATGVAGPAGAGLVQQLGLQRQCFARIHTFGKAVGCHGAVILGSEELRNYLVNFSRAFIYTTALPETSVAAIRRAYELFPGMNNERDHLQRLIAHFQQAPIGQQAPIDQQALIDRKASTGFQRLNSLTPIQVVIVPGNEAVRRLAGQLQEKDLDVRPILYPTVPKGGERLRIVFHAFNTFAEVNTLIEAMQ